MRGQELEDEQLTNPASQCLEISLLGPSRESVVVDFAGNASINTGPTLWALSVTWGSVVISASALRCNHDRTTFQTGLLHRNFRFRHSSHADPGSCLDWPVPAVPWLLPVRLDAAMGNDDGLRGCQ